MKQQIINNALAHADKLLGANYSKTYRLNYYKGGSFDCSSYTYACFSAAGFPLVNSSGSELITSYIQSGAQGFDVIYPKGGTSAIQKTSPKGTLKSLNPQPGDIVFYCWDNSTTRKPPITHVAMVYNSNTIIHNANNTEKCCKKSITYGDGRFNCLIRLKDNVAMPSKPTVKKGDKGKFVRMLQILLNVTSINPKLTCDANFGSKTESALTAYQKSAGLTANGICDSNTWNKLTGGANPEPQAGNYVEVIGKSVNVRDNSSTAGKVFGIVNKGNKFEYLGTAPTGWYQINYNGNTNAFISNRSDLTVLVNSPQLTVSRLLKQGMSGEDVWSVKQWLFNNNWYNSGVKQITNKTFGADTLDAVKKFQKAQKLTADGIVGKNTIIAMGGKWAG